MRTPSIKTIETALRLDRETAIAVKNLLSGKTKPDGMLETWHESFKVNAVLSEVSKLGGFHGVEYASAKKDQDDYRNSHGLSYCNAGDMYAATVIFDHVTRRYRIACLGDYLENPRHASRFE